MPKNNLLNVMPAGSSPETAYSTWREPITYCDLANTTQKIGNSVAQDNLVKGAAGQAVQNMNLMFSFAENAGLQGIGLLP